MVNPNMFLFLAAVALYSGLASAARAVVPVTDGEEAAEESAWFAHFYIGQFSATRFNQIVRFNADPRSSWLAATGVGRAFFEVRPHLWFEWELQAAQHWGEQSHPELNAAVSLRWSRFPWDGLLDTSIALGSGVSHAFRPPPIEDRPEIPAERTLKFMLFDIAAAPPQWEDWSVFTRIHHRSGVFGAISDARGSNFISLGLRRHF